ncbi:FMN-binding protein [Crateriforma conspicua]|uniref:Ion-translocating oxidoreductase complex subunit G n=1 Tax=Crateriforma conspicua TaxID=2527996 RepID=A0A5C5Y1T4_9PLAN|nr:FMN-binding protein [Crateriforma conspicua]TWT69110.1 Electron transport complex protein RnfG [Crateriforma conspicua]
MNQHKGGQQGQAGQPGTRQPGTVQIYSVLLGMGALCTLAIVGVFEFTLPIIQQNRIAQREAAILDVLPGATSSQTFDLGADNKSFDVPADPNAAGQPIYAGYDDDGNLVGLAIEASRMGYQDVIRMLYGYSPDRDAVIGTRVLESRETPGLGDRIEKDEAFLANFEALDVSVDQDSKQLRNKIEFVPSGEKTQPWQIDGITGATISSSTVAEMLRESTSQWVPLLKSRRNDFESGSVSGVQTESVPESESAPEGEQ